MLFLSQKSSSNSLYYPFGRRCQPYTSIWFGGYFSEHLRVAAAAAATSIGSFFSNSFPSRSSNTVVLSLCIYIYCLDGRYQTSIKVGRTIVKNETQSVIKHTVNWENIFVVSPSHDNHNFNVYGKRSLPTKIYHANIFNNTNISRFTVRTRVQFVPIAHVTLI